MFEQRNAEKLYMEYKTERKIWREKERMRRKDREITDRDCIDDIIEACDCCRLGFCDEGEPYIVPLNFGYDRNAGCFLFSQCQGRKKD